MSNIRKRNISIIIILLISCAYPSDRYDDLKLWYAQPANRWEEAMPLGNGRLGVMVYGTVTREQIQLNEETIWAGSPYRNDPPHALSALEKVRDLIFAGNHKQAQDLAGQFIATGQVNGMPYQTAGDLFIEFPGHENFTRYYRELDIQNALTTTRYVVDDVQFVRQMMVSFDKNIIIMNLTASKPGTLDFVCQLTTPHKSSKISVNGKTLEMRAKTSDHEGIEGKVEFTTLVQVINDGGKARPSDSTLVVDGADGAMVIISIATNFKDYNDISADPDSVAYGFIEKAQHLDFKTEVQQNSAWYRRFFDRVTLDLGRTESADMPTDERLKNFKATFDPQLVALYFQFGRYLLISSSQPGGQPATLQGIWNNKINPPWDSKYTVNINTEMNYWPAEITNLSEMSEPLVQMVHELSETGRQTAKNMYGARGWMLHHNTDIWRINAPIDAVRWSMWPMGGVWLSQTIWEKYLFNADSIFLAELYPVLKSAAQFYLDFLVQEPSNKWLVVIPSMSPENIPISRPGVSIAAGTTMDNQLVFDLFSNTIICSERLNRDRRFADSLRAARDDLPPMQIGRFGQLQEWLQDIDDPKDHHRHVSHLYGLYPSNQISPFRTPELFQAAQQVLLNRGDVSTGWSMGWKVNLWARLLDGNHAWKLIRDQLSPAGFEERGQNGGTYPNLFDAHPPFQIDGNFGCTAGIAEMLLQSHDGAIHILPAVPDDWQEGKVSGLKARGGFIVGIEWKKGRLINLVIKSNLGGNCRLRVPERIELRENGKLRIAEGDNPNPFYCRPDIKSPIIRMNPGMPVLNKTYVYDFESDAGSVYTFKVSANEEK